LDYWISGAKHRIQQHYSGIGLRFFLILFVFVFLLGFGYVSFVFSFFCLEETSVPIEQLTKIP
jgi:hypothetical protein